MHLQASSCPLKNPDCQPADISIPQLVGRVYESAPVAERIHLLEHLLAGSSAMGGSAFAALLVTMLLKRAQTRAATVE
jgi:hypothetical protein